jgi:hypothetical protein
MASPYPNKIKKTMVKLGIPKETIQKFNFPDSIEIKKIISFIDQMDELLSPEQCLSIMEEQGCCKTGKNDIANRAFGLEHADKTIEEKIKLLPNAKIPYNVPCQLNNDGTLTAYFENYKCGCYGIKKMSEPVKIPRTYCGCCGGFMRYHLQNALGVGLQLKEIVSSPNSSNGKKRCEFLFKIIEPNNEIQKNNKNKKI